MDENTLQVLDMLKNTIKDMGVFGFLFVGVPLGLLFWWAAKANAKGK